MAELKIDDVELHETKNVDSNGRVYLGNAYANTKVKVTVELLDNE